MVNNYVEQAVENFLMHTLGLAYSFRDIEKISNVYVTKIALKSSKQVEEFKLSISQELLNTISNLLLFEADPDFESSVDLACEVANLIIGNLKVILEESGESEQMELTPPEFLGFVEEEIKVDDESIGIAVDDKVMSIAYERALVEV